MEGFLAEKLLHVSPTLVFLLTHIYIHVIALGHNVVADAHRATLGVGGSTLPYPAGSSLVGHYHPQIFYFGMLLDDEYFAL